MFKRVFGCLKNVPGPGSSLWNPRSQRAKVRRMMATHEAQSEHFEAQALHAEIGGESGKQRRSTVQRKNRIQRSRYRKEQVGKRIAEEVKYMTDSEWQAVPMEDKHAFTHYFSKVLRERPSEASEQQRRRYFETTMVDPRELDPNRTVQDAYERLKLGLPVQLKDPQRTSGLTQALYESGDATLFDPSKVHELENAMTQVKQVYADYMEKRREGVSTEAERRQLAHLTAALNVETQRYLANLFKYSEEKVRSLALEEQREQLEELQRLRAAVRHRQTNPEGEEGEEVKRSRKKRSRKQRVKQAISKAIGIEVDVVDAILSELEAQEQFMQFCEVLARLTVGKGFEHTSEDEGLEEYTASLKKLYSVDAGQLSTLDAVQYMAAKDAVPPVEWAKRWYEKALLVPLQQTPEYQRLQQIRNEELASLRLKQEVQRRAEEKERGVASSSSEEKALLASSKVAQQAGQDTIRLVEKLFLNKDDARLQSIHEKRLKYLAYLQLERQIEQARRNAKLFEGVETSPEAEVCRTLYQKMCDRRRALEAENTSLSNPFDDEEMSLLFEQLRDITVRVIKERRAAQASDARRAKRAAVVEALRGVAEGEHTASEQLRRLVQEQKQSVAHRLLGILEKDVQSEVQWLEAMEEAERPPLLPVPQGMSYVSAADVQSWDQLREEQQQQKGNPFLKHKAPAKGQFSAELLAQRWPIPDKPLLFWGTGTTAVQQALRHAAEDADRRRRGEELAPPYPCAENPWGWRLVKDILDD